MNTQDYKEFALRTRSNNFNLSTEGAGSEANICALLTEMCRVGEYADNAKSVIFYGKSKNGKVLCDDGCQGFRFPDGMREGRTLQDLIHGTLGIFSESTEIAKSILESAKEGKEIDRLNIIEEVGDILWFANLIVEAMGTDWATVMDANIKKLARRYPSGYSDFNATNRNVAAEMAEIQKELSK